MKIFFSFFLLRHCTLKFLPNLLWEWKLLCTSMASQMHHFTLLAQVVNFVTNLVWFVFYKFVPIFLFFFYNFLKLKTFCTKIFSHFVQLFTQFFTSLFKLFYSLRRLENIRKRFQKFETYVKMFKKDDFFLEVLKKVSKKFFTTYVFCTFQTF